MIEHAYIKLVKASKQQTITIDELKDAFHYYKRITALTGDQLDWTYADSAFPYIIKETEEGKGQFIYLAATNDRYKIIVLGVSAETVVDPTTGDELEQAYIQITLPESATFGDKGKANEFAKFLAKRLDGELHLFNGRIMYYYKR